MNINAPAQLSLRTFSSPSNPKPSLLMQPTYTPPLPNNSDVLDSEANQKLNKGLYLMVGSGFVTTSALCLQMIAGKIFPKLEKSINVQVGVGAAGLAGMIYAGAKMILPAINQLKEAGQGAIQPNRYPDSSL